ncbi:unnamed protein product [Allacma fusca]|uniref:C2H2-type domain-containing protein n=1 Tax=Allacma fusca TaxID=39272 RepID=A0A8J2LJS8_9HEXA|nr:unnamed protein product [Allacma fusca]
MIQDSNGEEAQSNVKAQALPTPLDMCPLFSYSGSNALLPLPCEKVSLKSQHPPNKAHKCKHCEFETITYVELKRHSKVHCENEPSKIYLNLCEISVSGGIYQKSEKKVTTKLRYLNVLVRT